MMAQMIVTHPMTVLLEVKASVLVKKTMTPRTAAMTTQTIEVTKYMQYNAFLFNFSNFIKIFNPFSCSL